MAKKNLIVLVADKDMEWTVRGILGRWQALGIRESTYDIYVHPQRDPGCLRRAHEFLKPFARQYEHAVVLFDKEGCGMENVGRKQLEAHVEQNLADSGWDDRMAVIVLDPELESWVWSDSPHVDKVLGWPPEKGDLRDWLTNRNFSGNPKPDRPKEAMEAVLRYTRKPRSAAIYGGLASRVSLQTCVDPAFLKLRGRLQDWFG